MKLVIFRCCLAVLCLMAARLSASGETVTLTPVADTTLFEHDANNNQGKNSTFAVGTTAGVSGRPARSRAVLKFDVAGNVPPNATITSAALTIRVSKSPNPKVDSVFDLRRMLQSWNEGAKSGNTGSPAAAGETTWRARLHSATAADATLWSSPGGGTNTDFSTVVSASTMVRGLGSYTFASTPELVADVQTWLSDTNANHGWIMMSQSEERARTARRIGAREAGANDRPRLVLEFTVPTTGPPPALQSAQRLGDAFTFGFTAEANVGYTVEFTEALPAANWQSLTNVPAQSAAQPITVSDDSVTTTTHRFYRVRAQ
jgi:hypothetical protein